MITEYPPDYANDPDDMRVKKKMIDYDANGNQKEIREQVSDPEQPLGYREVALRENLWDEEDRLRAVDLNPEAPADKPQIASYIYSADGERTVRYLPGRLDAYYSAKDAGSADRLEALLYPNALVTVKTLPLPEGIDMREITHIPISKYTKHYYIGSERVASALGTVRDLGLLCEQSGFPDATIIERMNDKVDEAGTNLTEDYATFEKTLVLQEPFHYGTGMQLICDGNHDSKLYAAYWYHPDHLGSSSYITNLDGEINQHMEYLPFGETLVEEHLNSYNSPFKFNAKELDAETGNYYYGARYYDPKWSVWLSVDPLADTPANVSWSPYIYVWNNPLKFIDPDGRHGQTTIVGDNGDGTYTVKDWVDDGKTDIVTTDGVKIGNSLTTHSFVDDQGNAVEGAVIDPSDNSGQEFFNNEANRGEVWMWSYIPNATGGKDYDFKRDGAEPGDANYNNPQYHYRGMSFEGKIASARDVGNFTAGAVAAHNGLDWGVARLGFDALQKWQDKNIFSIEGTPTQSAQRAGFNMARPLYNKKVYQKITSDPFYGNRQKW
jgi:RHS repeat-associated protein